MKPEHAARPAIRPARREDRENLISAIIELQEYERRLHDSRLPGAEVAEPYLSVLQARSAQEGAMLVASRDSAFAGFVAGWVETDNQVCETADSNRFGYVSDISVLAKYRGQGVGQALLQAIETRLAEFGVKRLRLNALAANAVARASYERSGYSPYEVHYEKRIG